MAVAEKPELDSDLLVHYGVVGMKWGKTRARGETVDIKAARARVAREKTNYDNARAKAQAIKDGKQRTKAIKDLEKTRTKNLKNPDRVLAARMTRGEKAGTAVLGLVTGVGLPIAVAAIAGTSARSRRIEQKQDTGKYNK